MIYNHILEEPDAFNFQAKEYSYVPSYSTHKLPNVCYCDETNGKFYFIVVSMFETKIPQDSTLYT